MCNCKKKLRKKWKKPKHPKTELNHEEIIAQNIRQEFEVMRYNYIYRYSKNGTREGVSRKILALSMLVDFFEQQNTCSNQVINFFQQRKAFQLQYQV